MVFEEKKSNSQYVRRQRLPQKGSQCTMGKVDNGEFARNTNQQNVTGM